jgi:hypothetical protein
VEIPGHIYQCVGCRHAVTVKYLDARIVPGGDLLIPCDALQRPVIVGTVAVQSCHGHLVVPFFFLARYARARSAPLACFAGLPGFVTGSWVS